MLTEVSECNIRMIQTTYICINIMNPHFQYFVDYKLSTDYAHGDTAVPYATYFLQYIGFAAQVPNVIFNWINIFLNVSGSLTSRIVWTLLIEVIIFVVTIVLAMIDSRTWPGIFFYLTIFSVIILNSECII